MPATVADAFVSLKLGNTTALKTETAAALETAGATGGAKGGAAAGAGFMSSFRKETTKGLPKTTESVGSQLGTSLGKASRYGALALVGIGVASLKMAADFQAGLTTLVTGAGETEKNLELVGAGIKRIAVDSGTSTKDLIEGMYQIESAGYHGAAGLKVLSASAQGAKLANSDLGTVANAVTTVMKDYGLSGDQAVNATNALVVTVSRGKTHLQDLASSMARVLPTAAALGINMGQVGGAMATMTGEGTSARLAAMGLNATILALAAPSHTASKAVTALGGSSQQVAQTLQKHGLIAALQMVSDLSLKAGPKGSAAYVQAMKAMLGGSNGLRVGLQLTGAHMATLKANTDAVAGAFVKGGKNVTGWALAQKDTAVQFDKFKATLQVTAITIGQKLLPVASGVLTWLTKSHLILPLVIGVVTLLTAAFVAQAIAIQLTPIGWIVDGLILIGAGLYLLRNKWGAIWQWIRDAFAVVVDHILGLFGDILHAAADAFGWIPGLGGKLKAADRAFQQFRDNVNASLRGIKGQTVVAGVTLKVGQAAPQGGPPHAAAGMFIRSGRSGVDDQLILAQKGELVVPTWAVGAGMVDHLRGRIPGFAAGGLVGLNPVAHTPSLHSVQSSIWAPFVAALKGAFGGLLTPAGSGGGGVGGGAARWASVILQALSLLGQSRAWLAVVERRMNQESGGNPTVVNKWDSNWAAGTPSVGLMQVIGPTFRSYVGWFGGTGPFEYGVSVNPLANTYAGLNYALHRYGSLSALSRPGGYTHGGPIMEAMAAIGASGRAYTFHAGEHILPAGGMESIVAGLTRVAAILERQLAVARAAPARTSGGIAQALGGVARGAGYAALYPGGG